MYDVTMLNHQNEDQLIGLSSGAIAGWGTSLDVLGLVPGVNYCTVARSVLVIVKSVHTNIVVSILQHIKLCFIELYIGQSNAGKRHLYWPPMQSITMYICCIAHWLMKIWSFIALDINVMLIVFRISTLHVDAGICVVGVNVQVDVEIFVVANLMFFILRLIIDVSYLKLCPITSCRFLSSSILPT